MTPPPLPPGTSGWAVDPHIHTGQPEPDRDGADLIAECARLAAQVERLKADRRALDTAVIGLRALETRFADRRDEAGDRMDDSGVYIAEAYDSALCEVSALLDKIGATR